MLRASGDKTAVRGERAAGERRERRGGKARGTKKGSGTAWERKESGAGVLEHPSEAGLQRAQQRSREEEHLPGLTPARLCAATAAPGRMQGGGF